MSAINPKTSFPAAQIAGVGASAITNTSSSVAIALPTTIGGARAAYVRVACFQVSATPNTAAVHVRLAPTATSATATTGDTIVYSTESLWLPTLGMNAIGALGVTGNVRVQISPLEEGAIISSSQASGLG